MSLQNLKDNIVSNPGGSVFWFTLILLSFGGLLALELWSYFNTSLIGIILTIIFLSFVVLGMILSEGKIFNSGGWSRNSLSFVLGFILYASFVAVSKTGNYSVLSVSQNTLFSTISGDLPIGLEFLLNSFIIPICEEVFFLFGVSYIIIKICVLISQSTESSQSSFGRSMSKIIGNGWLQIALACIISGLTFAYFHMGRDEAVFIMAAIFFRTIATVAIFGDIRYDIIPYLSIGYGFSIGMHIGNNWANFGLAKGLGVIWDNVAAVWGGIVIVMLIAILLGFFNEFKLLKNGYYKTKKAGVING